MDVAKIFSNGRSQAVRLPKEYRLEGTEVYVRKIDDMVLLIPKDSPWKVMESSIQYFTQDYMEDRNQPEIQKREDF
ncbi:MAG: type II toxin-antitoxin system VapB family antitoxin [Clostridia bacterium]|nr:type II toxin-antitoxin system VapB family antitoxin [Clostridia bacterium]